MWIYPILGLLKLIERENGTAQFPIDETVEIGRADTGRIHFEDGDRNGFVSATKRDWRFDNNYTVNQL